MAEKGHAINVCFLSATKCDVTNRHLKVPRNSWPHTDKYTPASKKKRIWRRPISASRHFVADRQLQLFQLFHLWHTLPGFPLTAFFNAVQKAASLTRASLPTVFFTCITSSSNASRYELGAKSIGFLYICYLTYRQKQEEYQEDRARNFLSTSESHMGSRHAPEARQGVTQLFPP